VDLRVAGEGDAEVCMTTIVNQLEAQAGLLHMPGLTYLGMVETNELRGFGVVAQGELLWLAQVALQPTDQCLELLFLTHGSTHQASPPNTSTLLNTQTGDAWPTRIT